MDSIIDKIRNIVQTTNWEGPAAFAVTGIIILTFMKRWILIALVIVVLLAGAGIENYITFQLEFNERVITASQIVYIAGGVLIFFMAVFSDI